MKRIYLDYASLTPIDPRVLREMGRYSMAEYANPSSLYKEGVAAKKAMEDARKRIGGFLNAHADEIIFTSGGTEANALALEGALRAARSNGIEKPHLIISAIEHSSIMEMANVLEKLGVEVTQLGVDSHGLISLDELKKAIKPSTYLISIMTVNNEIGTIQPIREIAKAIRQYRKRINCSKFQIPSTNFQTNSKSQIPNSNHSIPNFQFFNYPLLHTDAAQAALFNDLNVEQSGVDLLTIDSSKVYGPRGIGALFIRRGTPIEPIIQGGGQERGLRSGTENVPAIMGFAKALELAFNERDRESKRISRLKEYFLKGLLKIRPDIKVNPAPVSLRSDLSVGSPNILNISIPSIENEVFVLRLDAHGVACSTKSSCLRDADESYVLKAIGADSKTSIRFSFGRWTKKADLDKALAIIAKALKV